MRVSILRARSGFRAELSGNAVERFRQIVFVCTWFHSHLCYTVITVML